MVTMRRSTSKEPNDLLKEEQREAGEGNVAWLERHGKADGVILLGGTSLADFRVRVAQSALRADMHPSLWSFCGILLKGDVFASVPFDLRDISAVPAVNGVQMCALGDYDDADRYPNIAIIRFAEAHASVYDDIRRVREDRSILDLSALMLPWLGFIWGASGTGNPLVKGTGLPSAAFVETVFAMANFELTPGLSSASSCPEAIWQSAKWWPEYFKVIAEAQAAAAQEAKRVAAEQASKAAEAGEKAAAVATRPVGIPMVPTGFYILRQRSAAVRD